MSKQKTTCPYCRCKKVKNIVGRSYECCNPKCGHIFEEHWSIYNMRRRYECMNLKCGHRFNK